jgi:hypothetical protein
MYAGTTLTAASGRILGAHQKIDRVARRHLAAILPVDSQFPAIRPILHFEGRGGPDAIKRKSPAHDEPWHYFNPFDPEDTQLIGLIDAHYQGLVTALAHKDEVVSAFEAAWLAHAVVDGLTPAHHFPYEEKLADLRGGRGKETRNSVRNKLLMPGDNRKQMLSNNWKMWGPKGLMTTHGAFEFGVSSLILPLTLNNAKPTPDDLAEILDLSTTEYFVRTAKEIAALNLYERFYKSGWTTRLARQVRQQLAPAIVKAVALLWYKAATDAAGRTGKGVGRAHHSR